MLSDLRRFEEARPFFSEALRIITQTFGEEHEAYARALYFQGLALRDEGKDEEAVPVLRKAVEKLKGKASADKVVDAEFHLARALLGTARDESARASASQGLDAAIAKSAELRGAEHPETRKMRM